jgi:hypothetical protein
MAAGDNLGRSCSRCRETQKKPCSFAQKGRGGDSSVPVGAGRPSVDDYVLRSEFDSVLAVIDKMQADLRRLESK